MSSRKSISSNESVEKSSDGGVSINGLYSSPLELNSKLVVWGGCRTQVSSNSFSVLKIPGNSAIYCIKSVLRQSSKPSPVLSKAISRHSGDARKHGFRSYMHVIICQRISLDLAFPCMSELIDTTTSSRLRSTYYPASIEAQHLFRETVRVSRRPL